MCLQTGLRFDHFVVVKSLLLCDRLYNASKDDDDDGDDDDDDCI